MPRPTNQLHALAIIINELRRRTPTALANATNQTADGYPTGTSNGPGARNTIADPTFNAVQRRSGHTNSPANLVSALEMHLADGALHLTKALSIVDKLLPAPGQTPRCSGGAGLDGSLEWGDPTCTNVPDGRPSYQGLCNACWQRQRRWNSEPRTAA